MWLYGRYIDDSNQGAEVPPPGSEYDVRTKKLIIDDRNIVEGEDGDKRLARVLKTIANSVQTDILMEEDYPNKNTDKKMPILDMKVWLDNNGHILHQHYEKKMTNKKVIDSRSAQSRSCKKSVHVQELLRRILNTSDRLDWQESVAPVLTDYMTRMMAAGYSQDYRKSILTNTLRIHDKMVREQEEGTRPINRPHDWHAEERRLSKRKKKQNWSTRGGYTAPIMVPATPDSELASELRKIAEEESIRGLKFRIVETGGKMVKRVVQCSNPTATPGCSDPACIACKSGRGEGGSCRKGNIQYQLECRLCPDTNKSLYIGETSRNLYSRGVEHQGKYEAGKDDSFMCKHQAEKHAGQQPTFDGKVTGMFRDCLSRQVSEGVQIRRCAGENIMNSKSEWHQPALWRVRSEVERL